MRRICLALLPAALSITGCSLQTTATPSASAGTQISGSIHGGQQPVAGAHIYMFTPSTAGYGQASTSLLNASLTLQSDSIGAYVTSDASGNFSITADYACTPNTQIYLYVKGGDAGSGTNSAIGLMAALGNCPSSGSFLTTLPSLQVNEVTTVAAGYALAGFATDPTHMGLSSSAAAQTGLANAFLTSANLASVTTGGAVLTTAAGNGTAPQARVNLLANILAACINSTSSASTSCTSLFSNAQASGVMPTDTAGAIINIAHNPAANVAALFALPTSTAPFAPALATAPADLTLPISYTGAKLSNFQAPGGFPKSIAVDGNGNIFTAADSYQVGNPNLISKFSPTGADLSSSTTFVGNSTDAPSALAVDSANNLWVANGAQNHANLAEFSNSGTLLSGPGYTGGALTANSNPGVPTFDPSGNIVLTTGSTGGLARFNPSGVLNPPAVPYATNVAFSSPSFDPSGDLFFTSVGNSGYGLGKLLPTGSASPGSPFTGGGVTNQSTIAATAVDNSGNAWVVSGSSSGADLISIFTNAGQPVLASGISVTANSSATGLALDGAGSAFLTDNNQSTAGSQIVRVTYPAVTTSIVGTGYLNTTLTNLVIDGSGNVWIADFLESQPTFSQARLIQFVGLAAPVVTSLAAAVAGNKLATRP